MVARDLHTGQTWKLWQGEFGPLPPFPHGDDTLIVAYMAAAEISCYLALGWPLPKYVLDLFVEFRRHTNGYTLPAGIGQIGALTYFGLDAIDVAEKEEMRALILTGGPWSAAQRAAILDYNESDVFALDKLLPAMLPHIDMPRALLRGRYMVAVALMEWYGIPIDVELLNELRLRWKDIRLDLIAEIDAAYGVYDGDRFVTKRWEAWLIKNNISWPRHPPNARNPRGALELDQDTFKDMARVYRAVKPMYDLRSTLAAMRKNNLAVGRDGRNRTSLKPFASVTSRNQPSTSKFVFGLAMWMRGLIKPPPGYGIAYLDYSQQEFAIAAALSGDANMMEAYRSGDPYLKFGKQANAIPPDGTKETHPREREKFKQCVLAVQYGMKAGGLANRIGEPKIVADDLLLIHRQTFRTFWQWSDAAVDFAMTSGSLHSVHGWQVHSVDDCNPRMLANWPMQTNGAEMLRLACCLGIERGIEICAPVHDAVLICAPLDRLDADVATMQAAMAEASRIVLSGFELRTNAQVVRYPDRYCDERGEAMWARVMRLLARERRNAG
jgi:hypothetical protein